MKIMKETKSTAAFMLRGYHLQLQNVKISSVTKKHESNRKEKLQSSGKASCAWPALKALSVASTHRPLHFLFIMSINGRTHRGYHKSVTEPASRMQHLKMCIQHRLGQPKGHTRLLDVHKTFPSRCNIGTYNLCWLTDTRCVVIQSVVLKVQLY